MAGEAGDFHLFQKLKLMKVMLRRQFLKQIKTSPAAEWKSHRPHRPMVFFVNRIKGLSWPVATGFHRPHRPLRILTNMCWFTSLG